MKKVLSLAVVAAVVLSFGALAYAEGQHQHGQPGQAPVAFDKPQPAGTKATCPVMGLEVTINEKTPSSQYEGKYYYFCCGGCKPKFDADPAKYVKK